MDDRLKAALAALALVLAGCTSDIRCPGGSSSPLADAEEIVTPYYLSGDVLGMALDVLPGGSLTIGNPDGSVLQGAVMSELHVRCQGASRVRIHRVQHLILRDSEFEGCGIDVVDSQRALLVGLKITRPNGSAVRMGGGTAHVALAYSWMDSIPDGFAAVEMSGISNKAEENLTRIGCYP